MASFNKVVLMGNITRTPDVRNIPASSTVVANTGIAVNRKIKDKEEVMFIDIVTYGKLAEIMGKFVTKGMPVLIEGRLTYRQWNDPEGQKRSKHEVVVDSFQMLGGNRDREDFNESSSRNEAVSSSGGFVNEDDVPF